MFNGNDMLRAKGEVVEMNEHEMEEYIRCSEDIFYFTKYFNIVSSKGREPIKFRPYQEKLIKFIMQKVPGKKNRIMMMGRQSGKTTLATVYLLWYALFHKDKQIYVLANQLSQTIEIIGRIQDAFLQMPLWLQQGLVVWNKQSMVFENGTFIKGAGMGIRGKTADLVLVDEFAHIEPNLAQDFIASVFPVLASREDSMLMLISTPLGMNHFYDIWKGAVEGTNSFLAAKVQWWEILDRDEAWKEATIKDIGMKKFQQEFACLGHDEEIEIQDDDGTYKKVRIGELYEYLRLERNINK